MSLYDLRGFYRTFSLGPNENVVSASQRRAASYTRTGLLTVRDGALEFIALIEGELMARDQEDED